MLQPALLKNIPTAMGEVDVLKMIQTLPGIKTVGEASSGYNVRGSAAAPTGIWLLVRCT